MKIGILDHLSRKVGGGQLVAAQMAARLSEKNDVDLIHSGQGYSLASLAKAFEVDLSRVHERVVESSHESFNLPGQVSTGSYLREGVRSNRELTERYDLFVYSGHGVPPFSFARRGVIYCHFPFEGSPRETLKSAEEHWKRPCISRWVHRAAYEGLWRYRMRGYQTVLANSSFTAHWIKRVWDIDADVVYPPVSLHVPVESKHNEIVSLGRFIDSYNSKGHMQQLSAFAELVKRIGSGWRLYLIGFCTMTPKEIAYLDELRRVARDLPVSFVVNAERHEVIRHLARAKLFWHTAGILEDEAIVPSRMEHFGIATVEAMLAGCVPLAPAQGGQVEIVGHGVSGYLCRNTQELVAYTAQLASDPASFDQMSRQAVTRGQAFNCERFAEHVDRLIG